MGAHRRTRTRVAFAGYERRAVDRYLAALEADPDTVTARADAAEIELAPIAAARFDPVPPLVEQLLEAARAAAALLEVDGRRRPSAPSRRPPPPRPRSRPPRLR